MDWYVMETEATWTIGEDCYATITSPFPIPEEHRKYIGKDNQLSHRFFYDDNGTPNKSYEDVLDTFAGIKVRNINLAFTPFVVGIGCPSEDDDTMIYVWLAENTRDVWHRKYCLYRQHNIIGFANQQDADNFAIFWALCIR